MSYLWHTFIFDPVSNLLVFFVGVFPHPNIAYAIIATTVTIRFLLLPLSKKVLKTQMAQQTLQPKVNEIRDSIKDKQEQSRAMMELYRAEGVNPFAGILLILVQIPIILSMYFVFKNGLAIEDGILYSFISIPETVQYMFLGINMQSASIFMAIAAGITQFISLKMIFHLQAEYKKRQNIPVDNNEMVRAMEHFQKMIVYILPGMVAAVAAFLPAGVALYWCTSNIFSIGQEYLLRRGHETKE